MMTLQTPAHMTAADPDRLRDLADWLDSTERPEMAAAARRAAADLDDRAPSRGSDGLAGDYAQE